MTDIEPFTCPVCSGSGWVSRPPNVPGDAREFASSSTGPWPCQPCCGTGVTWGPPGRETRLLARIELLETALGNATEALISISMAGSRESILDEMVDVRRFASNRAKAAMESVKP